MAKRSLEEIGPESCEYCGGEISRRGRTRGWTHCSHECRTEANTIWFRCPCGKWNPCYVNQGGVGKQVYCSRECFYRYRPRKRVYKRAERRVRKDGYINVRHPETGESILEHRLVMEQHIGRRLRYDEHVHHRDENRQNNDYANLILLNPLEHWRVHQGWTLEQVLAGQIVA